MAQTNLALIPSCAAMHGGVAAVTGVGQRYTITVGGTWAAGETWTLTMTDNIAGTVIGAGNITGLAMTYALTFGNKVYALNGSTVYFSEAGSATSFNNTQTGTTAGYVNMTNWYATPENLVAAAPFQGKLAFFSPETTQIWSVASDPAAWQQVQVLPNTGTVAPLSVQAIGDLDVFFRHSTGLRSLRSRDSTLNAYVDDLGSPLDPILAANGATAAQIAAGCGIVEPLSHRYWYFEKDTIYVYSAFRSSKVQAWSRYDATYSNGGTQTAFVPTKFCVFANQVYARAGDAVYQYGGTDNATYDNVIATIKSPLHDLKTPGTNKQARAIDVDVTGAWTVSGTMDAVASSLETIAAVSDNTYDQGQVSWNGVGTHFQWQAVTTGSTAAKFSELLLKYNMLEET